MSGSLGSRAPASGTGVEGGAGMGDIVYVAITVVFFWLTWQLVKLCERL